MCVFVCSQAVDLSFHCALYGAYAFCLSYIAPLLFALHFCPVDPPYSQRLLTLCLCVCDLRLRISVYAAPPQSMERHSRRAEVLHFALATMRGTSASGVAGVRQADSF
jgi:hypothetical protein